MTVRVTVAYVVVINKLAQRTAVCVCVRSRAHLGNLKQG